MLIVMSYGIVWFIFFVDVGVVLFCTSVFFFFFKQKTAYEMRISDWSSDVCSSDLAVPAHEVSSREDLDTAHAGIKGIAGTHRALAGTRELLAGEIGRASCRERVCQYV